jgi:hypothetical protein
MHLPTIYKQPETVLDTNKENLVRAEKLVLLISKAQVFLDKRDKHAKIVI